MLQQQQQQQQRHFLRLGLMENRLRHAEKLQSPAMFSHRHILKRSMR
jgi:hypothetical protein